MGSTSGQYAFVPTDPVNPDETTRLTPWDRRVVHAMDIADSAKLGAIVLRVVAAVVAVATVLGNYLYVFGRYDPTEGDTILTELASRDRLTVGEFLGNIAAPLALAGIVLAMSFMVSVYAARLDLDIVLSDQQETDPDASSDASPSAS